MKPNFAKQCYAVALTASILFLNGCIKDEDLNFNNMAAGSWSPELAVPLIHSDLSLNDIISVNENSLFNINNHLLSLVYKTNIYTQYGYEFFQPVNQSTSQTLQIFPMDSITLHQTGTVSRTINTIIPLTFPNGEQIDSLNFRKGELKVFINSDIPHPGILNITIPSATIGGLSFSKDIPFTGATSTTINTQGNFDLADYNMGTKDAGMPNMLGINYTLTFTDSSITAPTLNKNFDITLSFDSITPSSMFGFFGQSEFLIPADTAQIDVFNNFQGGSIYFDSPVMTIKMENSFGMPIDASINSLSAILENGSTLAVTGPVPSPLVDFPVQFGQTATNSFYFDNTNSNIQTILNSVPKFFIYNLSAGTNAPLPTYNFMSDSSVFKADLQIDLPLKGYASGFTIQDTVDFGLGEVDMISSANFRLNITNGFPVSANMQLYFADENNVIIDSLLTTSQNRLIDAAEIDNQGRATTPAVRMTDEMFEGVRLQHLFESKKIFIKAVIETKDAPNSVIALYDDYKLNFKIGVRTKLNLGY